MLNSNKTGLWIFDSFQIDFNLPKWKSRTTNGTNNTTPDGQTLTANFFDGFSSPSPRGLSSGIIIGDFPMQSGVVFAASGGIHWRARKKRITIR